MTSNPGISGERWGTLWPSPQDSNSKQIHKALRKIPTNNNHWNCHYLAQNLDTQQVLTTGFIFSVAQDSRGKGDWLADDITITWMCWIFISTSSCKHLGHSHCTSDAKQFASPLWDMLSMIGNDRAQAFPKTNLSGDLSEDIVSLNFVSSYSMSGLAKFNDSKRNMIINSQDRPWAILPGSKLLVNQPACMEEIWGK